MPFQRREKKNPLETVMAGLQIAKDIYGIKTQIGLNDNRDQQLELEKQKSEREQKKFELDQQKSAALADPTSAVSKAVRDQYKSVGITLPESTSGAEAKGLAEFVHKKAENDLKRQELGLRREERLAAKTEKEPSGAQFSAGTFARRMQQAEDVFSNLNQSGYDRTSTIEGILSYAPALAKSKGLLSQEQAERNFINATLRRESGAAISKDEFATAEKQYFPRVGDDPEVLKQKAENRRTVLEGLTAEAGPAIARIEKVAQDSGSQRGTGVSVNSKSQSGLIPEAQAGQQTSFSADDLEALQWVKSNPKDPRAAAIYNRLRAKGLK